MTLRQHLIYHLGLAAIDAVLIGIVMIDRSLGIGVMAGLGLSAITSAIRGHRREQKRFVELASALASVREAAAKEMPS